MARKPLPPVEHRFKPGVSGNPKGRPKGSRTKPIKMRRPALDETIRFPVGHIMLRMRRREAIVRFAQMRAISTKDAKLTALLLEADQKLREAEAALDYASVMTVIAPGLPGWLENIDAVVRRLGLGKLIYEGHPAQRVALKPEEVMLALSRLKGRELSRDEQKLVLSFTLTPHKVQWPGWWDADLRKRKCRVPERFFRKEEAEWVHALTEPVIPQPPPKMIDAEAESEAERQAWICTKTRKAPDNRCASCVRAKKKPESECPLRHLF